MERVRVDRWLWAARFFKTRSAASAAVIGGRVHVNGARVKAAKDVGIGDVLDVTIGPQKRTVRVTGISDRRGSATAAALLYEETPESIRSREQARLEWRLARPPGADFSERPTKRDRRRLDALRRSQRRSR